MIYFNLRFNVNALLPYAYLFRPGLSLLLTLLYSSSNQLFKLAQLVLFTQLVTPSETGLSTSINRVNNKHTKDFSYVKDTTTYTMF